MSEKDEKYRKMIERLTVHGVIDCYQSQNEIVRLAWLVTICLATVLLTTEDH